MSENDQTEFAAMLSEVMKYYGRPLTPMQLDMWVGGVSGYTLEQCRHAFNVHVRDPEHGQFPPKIADFARILGGTRTDRAAVAWGKVFDAMGRVGAYSDVAFDDAVIHAVVQDMGGWPRLCRWETSELSYAQHRFTESYRSLAERGVEGYPRVLSGDRSPDADYERRGIPVPVAVLIGDPKRCAAVIAGGGDSRAQVTRLPAGTNLAALATTALKLGGTTE